MDAFLTKGNMMKSTDLPFVTKRQMLNGRGYDFWSVSSTGNDLRNASLGREYCFEYLEFEAESLRAGNGSILGLILEDMMSKMDRGAIARNFIYTLVDTFGWVIQHPAFFDELHFRRKYY
jgi:hypothetical protein